MRMLIPLLFYFLYLIPLLFISVSLAEQLFFDFPNFLDLQEGDLRAQNLTLVQAYFGRNTGIQLTTNEQNARSTDNVGRVVYNIPLNLWDSSTGDLADFVTDFSFKITNTSSGDFGDGLAFFLAPFPAYRIPNDSRGRNLGLFNAPFPDDQKPNNWAGPTAGLLNNTNQVVAVEFDTFSNFFDPQANPSYLSHIGIDVHSSCSIQYVAFDNFSLTRDAIANATVSYKASTMNFTVLLSYNDRRDSESFGRRWNLSAIIDLSKYLPTQVAVGFSASTGNNTELHTLLSWNFSSTNISSKSSADGQQDRLKKIVPASLIITASVGIFLGALGLISFAVLFNRSRQGTAERNKPRSKEIFLNVVLGPKSFSYDALAAATEGFKNETKLGEGGFGSVHKGVLKDMNDLEVAIKKISKESLQGKKEYMAEVTVISQLRHRNLVQLIGYCHESENENDEFLLVYEYMPNRSLDYYLFDDGRLLPWPERYKIAVGLASALLYLHEEWEFCVIHRDIKPSNVMLDSRFNVKLGDFGLAKLVDHNESLQQTENLAGTYGYIAPEYAKSKKASKKSDVYSFGIVTLEITCGRKAIDFNDPDGRAHIVDWIWNFQKRKALLEAADRSLGSEFDEKMVERLIVIGMWCSQLDYNLRPTMKQVIGVLSFNEPLPELSGMSNPYNYKRKHSSSTTGRITNISISSKNFL